tara:strand:+ start:5811 stop:6128 length:318 start_codon:yes stop_codon:yes gene_type:complete
MKKKSRTRQAIGRANKRRGQQGNKWFKDFLSALYKDHRVFNVHSASGDPYKADLILAKEALGFQVKRMKEFPASIKKGLSDDGLGLFVEDSGKAIALIQIDIKEV